MIETSLTTETRLAWGAVALFGLAVVLALLGERTIPLFSGDRELAARIYKALFVALGGGMLALVAPLAVAGFIGRLRALFAAAGSDGGIALLLLRDEVPKVARIIGFALMAVFAAAGVTAAIIVWLRGS